MRSINGVVKIEGVKILLSAIISTEARAYSASATSFSSAPRIFFLKTFFLSSVARYNLSFVKVKIEGTRVLLEFPWVLLMFFLVAFTGGVAMAVFAGRKLAFRAPSG